MVNEEKHVYVLMGIIFTVLAFIILIPYFTVILGRAEAWRLTVSVVTITDCTLYIRYYWVNKNKME